MTGDDAGDGERESSPEEGELSGGEEEGELHDKERDCAQSSVEHVSSSLVKAEPHGLVLHGQFSGCTPGPPPEVRAGPPAGHMQGGNLPHCPQQLWGVPSGLPIPQLGGGLPAGHVPPQLRSEGGLPPGHLLEGGIKRRDGERGGRMAAGPARCSVSGGGLRGGGHQRGAHKTMDWIGQLGARGSFSQAPRECAWAHRPSSE